ncbi:MAG TPA: TetR/AcrR family transcriptional regulator C-terminal domain-containing protein [Roseiflexaceae bacterium]|nr:TetR/AcrR family transcriptional regulator C-terminal domain-containing protein [Roseiflexaceae bacterium]
MSANNKHASDPARLLGLLWRSRTGGGAHKHGPKPSLSVDRLVETAVAIADAEGIEAVTVRRLARDMGVAAMSLYTYVANKSDLVELMIDAVYLELPERSPAEGGWRARVTAVAEDNQALYRRHPWMAEVFSERPPLGPGVLAKYERELRALEGLGLSDVEQDAALTFLLNFVRAAARDEIQAARLQQASAQTNRDWWEAQADAIAALIDPAAFPTAARVGSAAGEAIGGAYSAASAYAFGLERVLDGLGQLIAAKARPDAD